MFSMFFSLYITIINDDTILISNLLFSLSVSVYMNSC